MQLGTWRYSVASDQFEWSDGLYRIAGLEPRCSSLTYPTSLVQITEDDTKSILTDALTHAVMHGRPFETIVRVLRPTGSSSPAIIHGYVERSPKGATTSVYGTVEILTDALKVSHERCMGITENMQDLISEVDINGIYTYASPSYKTLLRYEPDELIGRSVFELVHADDVQHTLIAFQTAIQSRSPGRAQFRSARLTASSLHTSSFVLYRLFCLFDNTKPVFVN